MTTSVTQSSLNVRRRKRRATIDGRSSATGRLRITASSRCPFVSRSAPLYNVFFSRRCPARSPAPTLVVRPIQMAKVNFAITKYLARKSLPPRCHRSTHHFGAASKRRWIHGAETPVRLSEERMGLPAPIPLPTYVLLAYVVRRAAAASRCAPETYRLSTSYPLAINAHANVTCKNNES